MGTKLLACEVPLRLVVFDMAGTTVDDMVDGKPVVAVAMQSAFAAHLGLCASPRTPNPCTPLIRHHIKDCDS